MSDSPGLVDFAIGLVNSEYFFREKPLKISYLIIKLLLKYCNVGAGVRALASHQCGPGWIPGLGVMLMCVEFVVGSCLPFSSKINTYKFQFDLESVSN